MDLDLWDILPKDFTTAADEHYGGRKYWLWEAEAGKWLETNGYHVTKWFTSDGDSFGPLVRGVQLTKDGVSATYYYG